MRKRKYGKYTPAYKEGAVELALRVGNTNAARQLEIPKNTIHGWVAAFKQNAPTAAQPVEPTPSPSEDGAYGFVLAFEARVSEFHAILVTKDEEIYDLREKVRLLTTDNTRLAKAINDVQVQHKSFREQLELAGKTVMRPLGR